MTNNTHVDLTRIGSFVGEIAKEHFAFVDSFLCSGMALFMPIAGSCGFAVTQQHEHPCPMFSVHFDDLTIVEVRGKKIQSKPDTTIFLQSSLPHHELSSNVQSRYLALFIPDDIFRRIATQYGLCWEDRPVWHVSSTPGGLLDCLKAFTEESRRNLPGREQIINGIALQVAHLLFRMLFGIDEKLANAIGIITANYSINRVIEYINRNKHKKINVDELAFVANLSPSYFTQTFRKETGLTPHRCLLLIRLHHSRRLLEEGRLNLTEIAYQSGFSSSSHFSVVFKKEFSLTPSEYQRKKRFNNR